MKVTEFSINREANISIGNYSSTKFYAGAKATLEEGDNPAECLAKLSRDVSGHLAAQVRAMPGFNGEYWINNVLPVAEIPAAVPAPAAPEEIEFEDDDFEDDGDDDGSDEDEKLQDITF